MNAFGARMIGGRTVVEQEGEVMAVDQILL